MENNSPLIENWWTDWQVKIVKDSTSVWIKKEFKAIRGVWVIKDGIKLLQKFVEHEILPPDAIIDNNAWDHEHCALCWVKISESINNQHEGYTDEKEWLCVDCYNKHIAPQKEGE